MTNMHKYIVQELKGTFTSDEWSLVAYKYLCKIENK